MAWTIGSILAMENPKLQLDKQRPKSCTKSDKYVLMLPQYVRRWDDFTAENIKAAYAHLLDISIDVPKKLAKDVTNGQTQIIIEGSVNVALNAWTVELIREPLKKALSRLQQDIGQDDIGDDNITLMQETNRHKYETSDMIPDWMVFFRIGTERSHSIAVGDSKCSSAWNSHDMYSDKDGMWPIRQVVTYCRAIKSRYGFIITPEELVVLRVYNKGPQDPNELRVQYESISWANSGDYLTVNLGLWALAMMSVNPNHRNITDRANTLPLNIWRKVEDGSSGSVLFEHHLSGRKLSDLPEGAVLEHEYVADESDSDGGQEGHSQDMGEVSSDQDYGDEPG
jgi:hypothetical protein